jgi:hypothetical protein
MSLTRSTVVAPPAPAVNGRRVASSVPVLINEKWVRTTTVPGAGVGRGIRATIAFVLLKRTCRIGFP